MTKSSSVDYKFYVRSFDSLSKGYTMTVEPSQSNENDHGTSRRQDLLIGEYYTEFLREQPRSRGGAAGEHELSINPTGKTTLERAMDSSMEVYFGQKAPLKVVSPIIDHRDDPYLYPRPNEQLKRQWAAPSIASFSDLAQDTGPLPNSPLPSLSPPPSLSTAYHSNTNSPLPSLSTASSLSTAPHSNTTSRDTETDSASTCRSHSTPNTATGNFLSQTNGSQSFDMIPFVNGKHLIRSRRFVSEVDIGMPSRNLKQIAPPCLPSGDGVKRFNMTSHCVGDKSRRGHTEYPDSTSDTEPTWSRVRQLGSGDENHLDLDFDPFSSLQRTPAVPAFTVSPLPPSRFALPVTMSSPRSGSRSPASLSPTFTQAHSSHTPKAHPALSSSHAPEAHTSSSNISPSPLSPGKQLPSGISDYDLVDTEVKFFDPSDKSMCVGVVSGVSSDKIATVQTYVDPQTVIKVRCSRLKLVTPNPSDLVKVVCSTGKLIGRTGKLLSVTGDCGVVQFVSCYGDIGRNLAQVKLASLGKYVKERKDSLLSKYNFHSPSESSILQSAANWSSLAGDPGLNSATPFPISPYPMQLMQTPLTIPPPFTMYNGGSTLLANSTSLSRGISPIPSTANGSQICESLNGQISSSFSLRSLRPFDSGGPVHYKCPKSLSGLPLSFQICPSTEVPKTSSSFLMPPQRSSLSRDTSFQIGQLETVSRGGGRAEKLSGSGKLLSSERQFSSKSSSVHSEVSEILERLVTHQRRYNFKNTDDGSKDVKTSCVRISLICPISQKRMKYPSRGFHCKHLQCFDAEAYITLNQHHRVKARVKHSNGRSFVQTLANKKWQCPICLKHLHQSQLYIDKSLMSVIQEYQDSVNEVELDPNGSWQPVKKTIDLSEVIDLTDDDG